MFLVKRSLKKEKYDRSKLLRCTEAYASGLCHQFVDVEKLVDRIESGICDGMKTSELNQYAAEAAASCMSIHHDFGVIAARFLVSNIHKETMNSFTEKMEFLFKSDIISEEFYNLVKNNASKIDEMIDYERDKCYTYFGLRTLMKSHLISANKKLVERPQDMLMRVALQLHENDMDKVKETYELASKRRFVHATPILSNAGTKKNQMGSCYLVSINCPSDECVINAFKLCSDISRHGGGIGVNVSGVTARGTPLLSGGTSSGVISMIKMFDSAIKYFAYSGTRRSSTSAFYIEPWHMEIFEFLNLRKNVGKEELRARNTFIALWVPDLFMKRVEDDGNWTLFCPSRAPGLNDVYGDRFDALYTSYENSDSLGKTIKARVLWKAIVDAQIETGVPYILYKDSCNRKNNQMNVGVLRCSNLCAEIMEYSGPEEVGVCNLASIALPTFFSDGKFDLDEMMKTVKVVVNNLNKAIDKGFYPVKEGRISNLRNRPIGLGVQGLADLFALMGYPFESEDAMKLNRRIFEAIYYSALEASMEIAKVRGPYQTYDGSPISRGILQFDMWNVKVNEDDPTLRWSWLRSEIKKHGVRNSLLIALMPTASTSQVLGYNECFEPFHSNIYARGTHAGVFQIVNSYLINELVKIGMWTPRIKNLIIKNEGSIQDIPEIPDDIKARYKTVWEMKMMNILKMAVDRAPFIDQTQSLNLFIASPTYSQITSMHFFGWKLGLKTGMYYLRTQPKTSAIKFTVDNEMIDQYRSDNDATSSSCSMDSENCDNCGA